MRSTLAAALTSFCYAFRVAEELIVVREWDGDKFHARVLELEQQGYVARRETYHIAAEMNPETGWVTHVHSIEMAKESKG